MNHCNIGPTGAFQLGRGLGLSSSLKSLSLVDNQIGDEGIEMLADSFFLENFCLENLNLSKNKITDIGLEIFTPSLNYNRTLKTLDLSANQVSDKTVGKLLPFVRHNTKLAKFNLDHTICKLRLQAEF